MNLLCLLLVAVIWAISLVVSVLYGLFTGFLAKIFLGSWAFWLGLIIGAIIFMCSQWEFLSVFHSDETQALHKENSPPPRRESSLLPFLLGLWLGIEFFHDND
jgi:putative Mn2+ efflux pump MntP